VETRRTTRMPPGEPPGDPGEKYVRRTASPSPFEYATRYRTDTRIDDRVALYDPVSAGKLALIVGAIALVAVVVIGLGQAGKESPGPPKATTVSAAEMSRRLAGAPPKLGALHRQANQILPGSRKALAARMKELRGHPVVLNVWAAWCGPCRAEMPVMQQVSLSYGKQVAFLGVDLKDNRESATGFLRRIPVSYPSYEDPNGRFFSSQGLQGVPSTLFYDRRGRQTFVHQGPYFQPSDLERDIRRYALGAAAS
jgi:cytochrome c biogenesis protein CcmG, thiol:disulfide interchange protein DsbE